MNIRKFRRAACGFKVVFFAIFLTTQISAAPASDNDKQRATSLLRAGAALMDRKDPRGALDKFTEAFRAFPSPKIQFNIGLALQALDRTAAAHHAFSVYLDGAKDDNPARRQEASEHLKALRARLAFVEIKVDLPDVSVSVDGVDAGRTPLPRPLILDPGPHGITFDAGGVAPSATRIVRAEAGGTHEVLVTLKPAPIPLTMPIATPAAPPALMVQTGPAALAPEAEESAFYKRPWFWIVAATVAAGAATAIVLTAGSETSFTCPPGTQPCLRGQ